MEVSFLIVRVDLHAIDAVWVARGCAGAGDVVLIRDTTFPADNCNKY